MEGGWKIEVNNPPAQIVKWAASEMRFYDANVITIAVYDDNADDDYDIEPNETVTRNGTFSFDLLRVDTTNLLMGMGVWPSAGFQP